MSHAIEARERAMKAAKIVAPDNVFGEAIPKTVADIILRETGLEELIEARDKQWLEIVILRAEVEALRAELNQIEWVDENHARVAARKDRP